MRFIQCDSPGISGQLYLPTTIPHCCTELVHHMYPHSLTHSLTNAKESPFKFVEFVTKKKLTKVSIIELPINLTQHEEKQLTQN